MNKNLISWAITALCVVLAVVLIFAVTKLDEDKSVGGIITGFFTPEEEKPSDNKNEAVTEDEEDWADPVFGEDDGFEGSDIPAQNQSSAENNSSASSSSETSSNSNNAPSINNSSKPSGGSSSSGSSSDSSSEGSSSGSSESPAKPGTLSYEEYMAMSGENQKAYMNSFDDIDDFFDWFDAAKAKYEEENPSIEIDGDGVIDFEEIFGENNP